MKMRLLLVFILGALSLTALAASKVEIDVSVEEALNPLYADSPAARKLASRAKGILVFPKVYKAGIGIGGEYGEGSLLIGGKPPTYNSIAAASIGFQLGAQMKSQVLMFMTADALNKFRQSDGWEAGVDGSVAVAQFGVGGEIDTQTAQQPIIGFIFSNKGLMYNLTLEGSKITPITR